MPDTTIGQSLPRFEDSRFLTGHGRFIADIDFDGQCHMAVVRSPHAHAAIRGIETSAAAAMPGVIAVHTHADLAADGLGAMPCAAQVSPLVVPPRHALAPDRVLHVGDPVAFVLAETEAEALDAAEAVEVDYDPLPAVTDPMAAQEPGSPALWPEAASNVAYRFAKGDRAAMEAAFAGAAHVVKLDIVNSRVTAAPMETRGGIGEYDPASDTWTLTAAAQGVHAIRRQLATAIFDVPLEKVQVVAPDVGGGFGLKNFLYPEWIMLLWAAKRHSRPVKWIAGRGEDFAAAAHGRDIRTAGRLALDAEGTILALHADLVANMGGYLSGGGPNCSTVAAPTAMGGIYAIPVIYMEARGVFTNMVPIDAYRGAGKPEANFIIERLIDAAARRCGFDPVELRLRNAVAETPYVTAQGLTLDSGRFGANIEDAVRLAGRAGFEDRRRASSEKGMLRGMGVACFLETARGAPQEGAEIRFADDGRVELRLGTESNGQGHETSFVQIAAERFGLPTDAFRYVQADTRLTRMGFGHGGARSLHMGGSALMKAIDGVLEKGRAVAAQLMQADAGAVTFADGRFAVAGSDRSVTLAEVAAAARDAGLEGGEAGLDTFASVEDAPFTFPNGCHVAEVEIDPDTGALTIARYVIVDDYGNLVNPMLTEGQVHGGVAQGIGQATGELCAYDPESGQLVAGSMMDYLIPRAAQIPALETHLEGVPTTANPLGTKGSGQAGAIAAPQTVVNAVLDALAPLGIDHLQMPVTSERIWRAIRDAGSS